MRFHSHPESHEFVKHLLACIAVAVTLLSASASAENVYEINNVLRQLSVRRLDIVPLSTVEKIAWVYDHPNEPPPPTVAYYVVDSTIGNPEQGKVVVAAYFHLASEALPWPSVSFDVVWHADRREAYLVLVRAMVQNLDIAVYRESISASRSPIPTKLEFTKRAQWPRESKAFASWPSKFPDSSSCGIKSVKALAEKNHLLIHLVRAQENCPPVYFRLDLTNGQISEVKLLMQPISSPASANK